MRNPSLTEVYLLSESEMTERQLARALSKWDGGEDFVEMFGEDGMGKLVHVLALAADQHGGFPKMRWYDWERAVGAWQQTMGIDPPAESEEMGLLDELIDFLEAANGGQKGGDPREPR
jgi:hypothetical protein